MNKLGLTVLLGAAVAAPSWAQTRPDTLLTVERYLDLEQVADAQISPDGKTVVYSRSHVDRMNDQWESQLWIVNADGTKNRFLTKGSSPVWSPDGTRLAYVGSRCPKDPRSSSGTWMRRGPPARSVTRLTDGPNSPGPRRISGSSSSWGGGWRTGRRGRLGRRGPATP